MIVAAQIAGALVPSVPAFAYMLSGLATGAALMLILARLKRGSRIVVSDERSRGIAEFAAAASFRVVLRNAVPELRAARRLTQEELTQALGVTRQTVISLEKRKYVPSLEMAFKVARFFGRNLEEVFFYDAEG